MGRWNWSGRGVIENTARLTIEDLRAWGFIPKEPGARSGTLTLFMGGKKTGDLGATVRMNQGYGEIEFDYRLDGKPVNYRHGIEAVPLHYGGARLYFKCQNCNRRVTALYFFGGYYACRSCHRLVYTVSRKHRDLAEHITRAQNMGQRADRLEKYGHPRKANRIRLRARQLEEEAFAYVARKFILQAGGLNVCPQRGDTGHGK